MLDRRFYRIIKTVCWSDPVQNIRWMQLNFRRIQRGVFYYYLRFSISLEPVGSKAPTFSSDSKISMFVRRTGDSFALLCQAQAYPVPLIRLVVALRRGWGMCIFGWGLYPAAKIDFPTTFELCVLSSVLNTLCISRYIRRPLSMQNYRNPFISIILTEYPSRNVKHIHCLICNIEPVGSKAPTFSAESKSFTFVKQIGHSFGLLCQAQAYPVPLIR